MRWCIAAILCGLCIGIAVEYWQQPSLPETIAMQNVSDDEILVTTLHDGSLVFLSGGGKLTYPQFFESNQRVVALEGEAFFEVKSDRKRSFIIETEHVIVEVMGTSFHIISNQEHPFELTVKSGAVKARIKDEVFEVYVEAGEQIQLVANWLQKTYVESAGILGQNIRRLSFKDEPLGQIVRAVNECTSGTVQLALGDESLSEQMITVTLDVDTQSMEEIAVLLCEILNVTQTTKEGVINIGKR